MEHITDADYKHTQKLGRFQNTKPNILYREYHDLYMQFDAPLLTDVCERFHDKCIEIHELDLAYFLSAPGLA